MNIIAQRGKNMFLVTKIKSPKPNDLEAKGVIVNLVDGTKSDSMGIQQVLKWGYWEEPDITDEIKSKIGAVYNTK